jgi:gliding motility-associated-like protein
VSGFDVNDIIIGNGTASAFRQISATAYSVLITPTNNGEVTIVVSEGVAFDSADNGNKAASASTDFDNVPPAGYAIAFASSQINILNVTDVQLQVTGAEVGAVYFYTIVSDNGGTPVSGSAIVATSDFVIAPINVEGLDDGVLTVTFHLEDDAGNVGPEVTNEAEKETASGELVIHTAFSPNGDGTNDVWVIKGIDQYEVVIEVFDRAGVRVYYSTTPSIGWDGRNHNGRILAGGYFYVVQIREIGLVKKGVLTVLTN